MNIIPIIGCIAVLAVAPGVVGCIRACKARFQNRRGASILLPYTSLLSLLKKEMTIPSNRTWVYHAVPFVVLAISLILAFLVPTLGVGVLGLNNIFFITAILALGSSFLVLGGMDTGSTFGNMGASREMTLTALVEPALVISLATLAFIAGSSHLDGIVQFFAVMPWYIHTPYVGIVFAGLLFVVLSENARYPVDNPATHLELTMVHEALLLEYSGPYLAMLEYASAVKLTVLAVFLASVIAPYGLALSADTILLGLGVFMLKAIVVAGVIAFVESSMAKMRFYRMQEYMMLAGLMSFGGLVAAIIAVHL